MLRALTAAVSVRNTRGPKRQRLKPAAWVARTSWLLKPPSGPTNRSMLATELGIDSKGCSQFSSMISLTSA